MTAEALARLIAGAIEGDYNEGSLATSTGRNPNQVRVEVIDNDDQEHTFVLTVEKQS